MPREQGKRKNTQARVNSNERSQGVGVHHTLDVQAERMDLSAVQQGLKSLHGFYQKKQEKADRLTVEQAKHDAIHDEADLERKEDDVVYRRALNSETGNIQAASKIAQIKLDYQERLKEDPNMDFDQFMQDVQNVSQEDYDDPDFLESYNKKMAQSMDVLREHHELNVAKMEVDRANDVASGIFDTLIIDGDLRSMTPTKGDMEALYKKYAELGLDPAESIDSLAKSALHYASNGKHEAAEALLQFIDGNDVNMGKYGRSLRDAIALSKQKAIEEAKKGEAATDKAKYEARRDLMDLAETGTYNEADALEMLENGLVTESQLLSIRQTARTVAGKKVKEADGWVLTQNALSEPLIVSGFTDEQKKIVNKNINTVSQGLIDEVLDSFRNLKASGDATGFQLEVSQIFKKNSGLMNYAKETGQIPRGFQSLFNSASLDNPHWEATAQMYKQLKAMSKSEVSMGMSQDQQALMEAYNSFVDTHKYTHEEAREILADRGQGSIGQAISHLKSDIPAGKFREMIQDQMDDLIGEDVEMFGVENPWGWADNDSNVEIFMPPAMKNAVMNLAGANYRYTGNAEGSLKFALERIKANYVPVNGNLIPRENKPPMFFQAFHHLQDPLKAAVASGRFKLPEGFSEEDLEKGFTLIPIDGHEIDGRMQIAPADNPLKILTNADGSALVMRPQDVVEEYLKAVDSGHWEELRAVKERMDSNREELKRLQSMDFSDPAEFNKYSKQQ